MTDKVIEDIIEKAAFIHNISPNVVNDVWQSQFKFIRKIINENTDIIKEAKTKEEFDNIKKNFNVPYLFKFYASWKKKQQILKNTQ